MSITTDEEATNRERMLVCAAKAGLKAKHLKKIRQICVKYAVAAPVTSPPPACETEQVLTVEG